MAQLNVNLLPQDSGEKKKLGLTLANKISIGVLIIVIVLSIITGTLKVSESKANSDAQAKLTQAEADLTQVKTKESILVILKQHIKTIQTLLDADSNKKALFDNIVSKLPADAKITNIDIDRNNNLSLTVGSTNLDAIQNVIDNFTQDGKRLKQITQVSLDRLTLERDGLFKVSLKITE